MRDEFWLEDQSPDLFDIEDDQTPDSFGAFSNVLRGPEGPPGPPGPPGADGTVSFDELTPAQRESLRGEGVPAGGTTGQVLAKSSNTDYETEWVNQSGGSAEMTILSYGNSTWADFIAAYNAKSIVYCRASITAANPGAGSQVRMAVMAHVNHPTVPTSVDFVYYYPAIHSDSQQGDQLFVYTLSQTNGWSYVVKNTFSKIVAGENMSSSYANGTLTLNATGGGGGTSDYDALSNRPSINGTTLSGNKTAADLGLGTYSKPSGGIPQTDLESAVQNKLDSTVVVSDTQPTETENKLWVDTDAGAGASYQIPTVAEMEAADAQVAALIDVKHIPVWPTPPKYNSVQDVVDVLSTLPTNSLLLNTFGGTLKTNLFTTESSYDGIIACFKASGNNIYYLAYSRDVAAIGNISIPNVSVTIKHSLL